MIVQIHGNQNLLEHFWGGHGQKWVWPLCSWESKIDSISKMNRCNN